MEIAGSMIAVAAREVQELFWARPKGVSDTRSKDASTTLMIAAMEAYPGNRLRQNGLMWDLLHEIYRHYPHMILDITAAPRLGVPEVWSDESAEVCSFDEDFTTESPASILEETVWLAIRQVLRNDGRQLPTDEIGPLVIEDNRRMLANARLLDSWRYNMLQRLA